MGYIITIKYHPKAEDGNFGFDLETTEEKELKLGEIGDEINHSQLALTILKQLSRRDIYVFDVEAVEFVKKVLKVKESKNGIIIGQKKYTFDDAKDVENLNVQEIGTPTPAAPAVAPAAPVVAPAAPVVAPTPIAPPIVPVQKVIRKEYFDPELPNPERLIPQFTQLGLTIGKQYSIIAEDGVKYTIINDSGGRSTVPMQHFSAVSGQNLIQGQNVRLPGESSSEDIPLSYPGEVNAGSTYIR